MALQNGYANYANNIDLVNELLQDLRLDLHEAEKLFEETVKRLAEKEGLTEKVKKKEQMEWVRKMNNVRNRAMEIVNREVIFV